MAKFAMGGRATIAGTATLPLVSLYGAATVTLRVREIGLFNTTAVACTPAVQRVSTVGTQGVGLTEAIVDNIGNTPTGAGFAGHTGAPTITAGEVRRASIGAAVGAGVIWTWGDYGLVVPAVAAAGIGITVPVGTGQILDYYIEWEE